MWLKKTVKVVLLGASLLVFALLVWGLVFTKADPNVATDAVNGSVNNGQKVAIADAANPAGNAAQQPTDNGATQTPTSNPTIPATPTVPVTTPPSTGGTTTPPTTSAVAPLLTLAASPMTITSGSSSTLGWSTNNTATAPVACTASGAWSGSRATSGSQSISPTSTSTYTLVCSNSGGSSTKSVTVTVNAAVVTYCGGNTPCYSNSDLAAHASGGSCWGYITYNGLSSVYNIGSFAPNHSGGSSAITAACGGNIGPALTSAPGNVKHTSALKNTQATLNGYRVGYYDAAKP